VGLSAIGIGNAALHLGAGRQTKADAVDHAVGVVCLRKRHDRVEEGESLAEVHARDDASAHEAAREVLAAYQVEDATVTRARRPVVLEVVG
jgi:pyrimidine-nucleoside phosphorylase